MFTLILDETLKETTVQGSRDFPFEVYFGGVSKFEQGYLDWHWHDNFEINMVVSGSLLYYIEDKEYLLKAGDAILINSGRLHRAYANCSTQDSHTFVFSGELFCSDPSSRSYLSLVEDFIHSDVNGLMLTPDVPWMKQVLSTLETISLEYTQKRFAWQLTIKGLLCTVFASLLNNIVHTEHPSAAETEKKKRIRLLLSYIAQNYMNPISLSDLASLTSLSETECSRFFSSQMKQAPFAYLTQYRIERSCELLVNTDLLISEIALQTGFNNFSYYSKRFREAMNCTPSEYRAKIRIALQKDS